MDGITKVKKMVNISSVIVPVQVAEDLVVQVPPKGKLENTDVHNLPKIRSFFKVTEEGSKIEKGVNLNEG